jgi:hypothetical protein
MANKQSGGQQSGSGGGARCSHVSAPKREPIAHAVSPGRTSTIGQSVFFNKGPIYSGPGNYVAPVGPSTHMGQGPGANREVMRSGSQGQYGSAAGGTARSSTPDIFTSFSGKRGG